MSEVEFVSKDERLVIYADGTWHAFYGKDLSSWTSGGLTRTDLLEMADLLEDLIMRTSQALELDRNEAH